MARAKNRLQMARAARRSRGAGVICNPCNYVVMVVFLRKICYTIIFLKGKTEMTE